MKLNILVTGGAGYIGSVAISKLLENGHKVHVIDNFMYNQSSLNHYSLNKNFQVNKFKIKNLALSIISLFLLIFYFDYQLIYGGGIFYRLSIIIFNNNYLYYIFILIILNIFILIFTNYNNNKDRIFDLTFFLVLIFLEIDDVYYHETYDPLIYFVFFLLVKNKFYINFEIVPPSI